LTQGAWRSALDGAFEHRPVAQHPRRDARLPGQRPQVVEWVDCGMCLISAGAAQSPMVNSIIANGHVAASFAVPGAFAGSTIPGRRDTFQAKGRQSGTIASTTFTVTG
jgi:hypothetical protein